MVNNIDLTKIIEEGEVVSTKKMNIKGTTMYMDVYRIPLKQLYYNDKNDRIATWISKYEAEEGDINRLTREEYNRQIQNYIIKSDQQKFKKTLDNIRNFGQLEPGVVLVDGRVIDGNRRFTCLRQLHEETGNSSFYYFDAVILQKDVSDREIKLMELTLQHGQEGKVDYNPIEKLVGIYRDIVRDKIFNEKEYAESIGVKESIVKKSVTLSLLMVDFLEYINAPEQFYIARELEIDGPLNEIYTIKNRIGNDEEKWEKAKIALYDNLLLKPTIQGSADPTRNIRAFGQFIVSDDEKLDEYFEEHEVNSRELVNILNQAEGDVNTKFIRENIRNNEKLKEETNSHLNRVIHKAQSETIQKMPVEIVKSLYDDLRKLDLTAVSMLNGDDKENFLKHIDMIELQISKVKESLNEII